MFCKFEWALRSSYRPRRPESGRRVPPNRTSRVHGFLDTVDRAVAGDPGRLSAEQIDDVLLHLGLRRSCAEWLAPKVSAYSPGRLTSYGPSVSTDVRDS